MHLHACIKPQSYWKFSALAWSKSNKVTPHTFQIKRILCALKLVSAQDSLFYMILIWKIIINSSAYSFRQSLPSWIVLTVFSIKLMYKKKVSQILNFQLWTWLIKKKSVIIQPNSRTFIILPLFILLHLYVRHMFFCFFLMFWWEVYVVI